MELKKTQYVLKQIIPNNVLTLSVKTDEGLKDIIAWAHIEIERDGIYQNEIVPLIVMGYQLVSIVTPEFEIVKKEENEKS
jgi:hypothetical protein